MVVEARWYEHVPDVLTIEALAAQDGLLMAASANADKIILEADCAMLACLLEAKMGRNSPVASSRAKQVLCLFSNISCKERGK